MAPAELRVDGMKRVKRRLINLGTCLVVSPILFAARFASWVRSYLVTESFALRHGTREGGGESHDARGHLVQRLRVRRRAGGAVVGGGLREPPRRIPRRATRPLRGAAVVDE